MKADLMLIRYGELTLKGKNRRSFEDRILTDIQWALRGFEQVKLSKTFGRLYVRLNGEPYDDAVREVRKVFGISSFSPAWLSELDVDKICAKALEVFMGLDKKPNTFKVTVKRANKNFVRDSQEMNQIVGAYILRGTRNVQVDVHHPEKELFVEIREEGAYIYCDVERGLGGYPLGSNGMAMLMISGGIDSPVAGWMSLRKGLKIEAVHFHSFPYTSERAQRKVEDLTRKLAEYGRKIYLHMVPFTDIQTRLKQEAKDKLLITLMRRAMFRITEKLALAGDASAIITGESLGQVASQTLPSLRAIDQAVRELPVLRPLAMMDKLEIIRIAEQIETYPISILPYEDCCTLFVPKNPSTNPNQRILDMLEHKMSWLPAYIERAVEETETRLIKRGVSEESADAFF